MKTLLVYSNVPEDQYFFIIPDNEMLPYWEEMLSLANGKLVNLDDMNAGMKWLMAATSSKKEYCDADVEEHHHCCLLKYKHEASKEETSLVGPFSKVYVSGYIL
jgi:hypothetical protein